MKDSKLTLVTKNSEGDRLYKNKLYYVSFEKSQTEENTYFVTVLKKDNTALDIHDYGINILLKEEWKLPESISSVQKRINKRLEIAYATWKQLMEFEIDSQEIEIVIVDDFYNGTVSDLFNGIYFGHFKEEWEGIIKKYML